MTGTVINQNSNNEINLNLVNTVNKSKMSLKEKWHRKLGHVNFEYLNIISKNELLSGIPKDLESEYMKCAICIQSKMHDTPFDNNRKRANDILEIIHTDINGPHPTTGNRGERFFLSFVDDYSKLCKVYCIRSKTEVLDCFVEYVNLMENLTNKRIKTVRCDNGKEYLNASVYKFVREKGIYLNLCPPYVHQLNGVAERFNRTTYLDAY